MGGNFRSQFFHEKIDKMYKMSFFFSLPSRVQMIFYTLYTAKPSKELQYNVSVNNQLV